MILICLFRRLAFYKPRPWAIFCFAIFREAIGVGLSLVRSLLAALIKVVDSFVSHENQITL